MALALSSCTAIPDKPVFSETEARNASLKVSNWKPIEAQLQADCMEGSCIVTSANLEKIFIIIDKLNDEIQSRIDALNESINGLNHCEYNNELADYQIQLMKNEASREKIISTARNVAYLALCGAGLIYGR